MCVHVSVCVCGGAHSTYGVCVLQRQNVCSQRVKSCVQPNTGDLLSQAVNGGRTPRTGRVQG